MTHTRNLAILGTCFVGGFVALALANLFWYPAPDLHSVQLGLLMSGIFLSGSIVAMVGVAAAAMMSGEQR